MLSTFTKTYNDASYRYPTMVTHNGTVIALAMNDKRQIFYRVLNLNDTTVPGALDVNFWQQEQATKGELRFPSEIAQVGYGVADQVMMPAIKQGRREPDPAQLVVDDSERDFFLSTTARLTADAPFQALSDGRFVYIFRQAIGRGHADMVDPEGKLIISGRQQPVVNATLLVDRFVLVGAKLEPKMEVRYRRSRSRYNPQSRKDSLGAKDMEEKSFYEPTQELAFVGSLRDGRFTVLLLPTTVAEVERWQIFAQNAKTGLIDSFNIERGTDGLFNTRGSQFYTCSDHHEVFEQRAGKCVMPSLDDPNQPCDKNLLPLVSTDGYAESALAFDGVDDYVDLGQGIDPGAEFTLEAWVLLDRADSAERVLLSGSAGHSHVNDAPSLAIVEETRLRASFGDGAHSYAVLSDAGALKPHVWTHVAAAYDGRAYTIFVDGEECPATFVVDQTEHTADDLREKRSVGTSIRSIGAAASLVDATYGGFFAGTIDEIRIWSRARSADEIRDDMHQRLVGHEPGLAAYWRFDESTGTIAYDQTDSATNGSLHGDPRWNTSGAPVGENSGISRGSFRLAERQVDAVVERTVESGLAAILYYQQEKSAVPIGYDREQKPLKQNARVMLALATRAAGATDDKREIAALDFAVSRAGKLAQAQDVMVLTSLKSDGVSNETLDAISALEQQIAGIADEIGRLDGDIVRLTGESSNLDTIKQDYEASKASLATAQNTLESAKNDISNYYHFLYNIGKDHYAEAFSSHDEEVRVENNDLNGPIDDKLWQFQPFGQEGSYVLLNKGKSRYAEAFESDDWRVRVANSNLDSYPDDKTWRLIPALQGMYLWNVGKSRFAEAFASDDQRIRVASDLASDHTSDKSWVLVKREDKFSNVERPNTVIVDAETALKLAQNDYDSKKAGYDAVATKIAEIEAKKAQRDKRKAALNTAQGNLTTLKSRAPAAVALPMPLLHVDPYGLTIAGSVLGFAWTKATPLLYGSATGKLALYFQGASDQFFVAYYDTLTAKARYSLSTTAAPPEYITCQARSAESELDQLQITVSDACIGALAADYSNGDQIELAAKLDRDLADGATLLLGKHQLTVRGALAAGATSIPINKPAMQVDAPLGTPVCLVEDQQADTCTVTISGVGITEIWREVPREPRRFAEVLNGQAGERAFVGNVAVRGGLISNLDVAEGLSRELAAGATLLLGQVSVKVREPVAEGATSIPIEQIAIGAPGGASADADQPLGPTISLPFESAAIYSDGVFVGFGSVTRATLDTLELPDGLSRAVPDGTTLLITQRSLGAADQSVKVKVRQAAKAGDRGIAIDSAELSLNAEQTTIDMIAYDYTVNAETTKVPGNLASGSLLIVVNSAGVASKIAVGQIVVSAVTPTCRWLADAPNDALLFDGKRNYAGLPRTALQLDGSDDYLELPASLQIDSSTGFTIEAWLHYDAFNMNSPIIDFGNGEGADNIILANDADIGALTLTVYNGGQASTIRAAQALDIGEWIHVAATIDAAGQARLYKNGQLLTLSDTDGDEIGQQASMVLPQGITRAHNYVGKGHSSIAQLFGGRIDELRFWNRARTPDEISANVGRRMNGSEPDLAGCWRFDEGLAHDYSGHSAEDATLYGGPQPAPGAWHDEALAKFAAAGDLTLEAWVRPEQVSDTARVIQYHQSADNNYAFGLRQVASALQFDGDDDHIVLPQAVQIDALKGFTIEAWVYYDGFNSWSRIVDFGNGEAADNVILANKGTTNTLACSFYTGNKQQAYYSAGALETGVWIHIAASVDATGRLCLYKNGVILKLTDDQGADLGIEATFNLPTTSVQRLKNYIGKSNWSRDGFFKGRIDEVRLWSRARTAEEIGVDMSRRLTGSETDLAGYWHFEERAAHDYTTNQNHGTLFQKGERTTSPTMVMSPLSAASAFAIVNRQPLEAKEIIPAGTWSHLAAVFDQSYAVKFNGLDAYLDCGNDTTLDISSDLTIEAYVWIDNLGGPRGILSRGAMDDGTDDDVPYALYVDSDGRLAFAFEDGKGENFVFKTDTKLSAQTFYKLAVTRQLVSKTERKPGASTTEANGKNDTYAAIKMYINGTPSEIGQEAMRYNPATASSEKTFVTGDVHESNDNISTRDKDNKTTYQFRGDMPGSSDGPLTIGRSYLADMAAAFFQGAISEVRIWSLAREQTDITADIKGKEKGLVSWWRFEENAGAVGFDSKSSNHAKFHGGAQWMKDPNPNGSTLALYHNGVKMTAAASGRAFAAAEPQFCVAALGNPSAADFYKGQLDELRIWKITRTEEQIQDGMFERLLGERDSLIARYTFNHASEGSIKDSSFASSTLSVNCGGPAANRPIYVLSTAPIGADIPDARNAILGIKTSFHGQIQSRPAVGEYADMQFDADGNLIGVLKRCYAFIKDSSWQLVTGFKVGNLITEWVGQVQRAPQLIGFIEGAPPVPSENLTHSGVVLGEREDYNGATAIELTQAASTTYTYSADKDTGFDMSVEAGIKVGMQLGFKTGVGIGAEIITDAAEANFKIGPKVSFENSLSWLDSASTGSGLTTTKASRMELRGKYENEDEVAYPEIGRRFVPDNVGYALVQSETNDVFALRLQHNNALVAYQMRPNPDIEKDWNIITFPINSRYTKQGTLDGKIGLAPDADYPNATEYSPDSSYFKPIEAYALKNRIRREEAELQTYYDQYDAGAKGRRQDGPNFSDSDVAAGRTLAKLPQFRSADDPEQRLGKDASRALKKRNMVNTYVWTADGGLFAESEETMDVQQESHGGAYAFKGMAGLTVEADIVPGGIRIFNLELQAMFGGHLNLTVNKSWDSETSFGMNVEVGTESDLYRRDDQGNVLIDRRDPRNPKPLKEAGKVDAYRFLSFYLEPRSDHFDLFFNKIVDPIWLAQSDEPNAMALREAQSLQAANKPACWRMMHRVTYVSRILPPIELNPSTPVLEKTLQTLDIDSNYELIKKLEPFVKHKTGNAAEFYTAVDQALTTYLPELLPHAAQIKQYIGLYFGVSEDAELGDALESSGGSGGFTGARKAPVISIKPVQPVGIPDRAHLEASITAGSANEDQSDISMRWSQLSGPGSVMFTNEGAATTDASFSQPGVYVVQLKVDSGGRTASARTTLVVGVKRVADALQALYTFEEGAGATVRDVSGSAQPMDLTIENPAAVTWASGRGGLIINTPTILAASRPATALAQAAMQSKEVTIEAWIAPRADMQSGLARIVTLADGTSARNVTLGQSPAGYHARLRTDATNLNASDQALTAGAAIPGQLAQVVYTRDKYSMARLYVNGVEVGSRTVSGELNNWSNDFALALANERAGRESHPWLGELRLVAIYSSALSLQQIRQNYSVAPVVTATAARATVLRPAGAQLRGTVTKNRLEEKGAQSGLITLWSGPQGVIFTAPQELNTGASFPDRGIYTLRLTADDGHLSSFAEVVVTVNQAPQIKIGNKAIVTWPDRAQLVVEVTNSGLADPAGVLSMSWAQQSGRGIVTATPVDGKTNTWTAAFSESGTYVLRLSADNGYAQTTQDVTLIANRKPVVVAGSNQTITLPGSARLEGIVIDDGLPRDSGKLAMEWSVVDGDASKVTFDDKSADHTVARFKQDGAYRLRLTARDGAVSASDDLTITVKPNQRETDDLQALYIFEEGAGDTIYDVSNAGTPLHLTIKDRAAVRWLPGSAGLAIVAPTVIASQAAASKITSSVRDKKEITIEAWVKPANTTQNSNAGIVTLTAAGARNAALGQNGATYNAHLALKSASQDLAAGSVATSLTQVVYTRDKAGNAKMYVNGEDVTPTNSQKVGDNFDNWDVGMAGAHLAFGNELTNDHPWLGELYLVAIYNRALGKDDINKNRKLGV